jgi:dTMP kinase
MAKAHGKLITFEGGDASGKTTQVLRLADRLRLRGLEVVVTREPGGSPGAEAIRHVLLSGFAKPLGPDAEALLFAAARDDHVNTLIRPALESGAWVISDRFLDSTRVYQGIIGGVDMKFLRAMERLTLGGLLPDMTILLDVPPETSKERAAGRGGEADRFESESDETKKWIREAFKRFAESEPQRWAVVDAGTGKTPDTVAMAVWMQVSQRLLRPQTAASAPRAAG